ncbi:tail fiber domain-containing protein [Kitasatospora sp. NPDC059327]|uniref:tail fiber domain-containing protein n=1 Tax=Kitasatospora sp. NPDC059327 TaxID=3346803 RepID=UPI0036B49F73
MTVRIRRRPPEAADHAAAECRPTTPPEPGGLAPVGTVNGHQVLARVAALPISTWRYRWEPEDVRHLGPMAQDWHAAFGFNPDDTTIPVVDGLGVTLVCVQALHRRVDELTAEVGRLREAANATGASRTTRADPEGGTA